MNELLEKLWTVIPDKLVEIRHTNYMEKEWYATSLWKVGTGNTIEEALEDLYNQLKP